MAACETIISSNAQVLRAFVRARSISGHYGNASEMVGADVHLLERHEPAFVTEKPNNSCSGRTDAR